MVAPPRDGRARQRGRLGARAAQRGPDHRADAIRETVGFAAVKASSSLLLPARRRVAVVVLVLC